MEVGDLAMLLTVKQVATRLNVSVSTIYEEIRTERLSVFRIGIKGGTIRISEGALTDYLESRRDEPSIPNKPCSRAPRVLKHLKLREDA